MDGLSDDEQIAKNTNYSPASETETERKQREPGAGILPGSGGPDDTGAIDADDTELNPPRDTGAH